MLEFLEIEKIKDRFLDLLFAFTPSLVSAIFILIIGFYVAKAISHGFAKILSKPIQDKAIVGFLQHIIFAGIFVVVIVAALSNLGVQTGSILAVLGTAGLAIALSLKDSLSNLASGILLVALRHFKKNDLVQIGSITGRVESISLFNTKITTPDNKLVILPNSSIVNTAITNIEINETRRNDMIFGIAYDADLRLAKEIAMQICKQEPRILNEPEPIVGISNLGESSVDILVRFWCKSSEFVAVELAVREAVKLAFDEAKIEIPYNKLDLYLQNANNTSFLGNLK